MSLPWVTNETQKPASPSPVAVEFTDQPSPFSTAQPQPVARASPPTSRPVAIPAGSRGAGLGPQDVAKQAPSPSPVLIPIERPQASSSTAGLPPLVEVKPQRLSSLGSLVGTQRDTAPAAQGQPPKEAPLQPIPRPKATPAIVIPDPGNIAGNTVPAMMVSKPPSGSLVNPLQLKRDQGFQPRANPPAGTVRAAQQPSSTFQPPARLSRDSVESAMKRELEMFKSQLPSQPKTSDVKNGSPGGTEEKILPFSKDPDSLNDILKDLVKVDPVIKASALVKRDGSLLGAAISAQISDSLVATIATTVLNIASTILFSMDGGELRYITITGDDGIVHVVPVLSDLCLVILTGSTSKKGVIEVMARQVEKSVKKYLNLE